MARVACVVFALCVGSGLSWAQDPPPQFGVEIDDQIPSVLAYSEQNKDGSCSLYVVGPGHAKRTLVSGVVDVAARREVATGGFVWSPDGKRIAFASSGRGGARALYVASPAGDAPRQVAASLGQGELSFAWAPSGTVIAFRTADGRIYAVTPDGATKPSEVTEGPGAHLPAFAPRGATLAFVAGQPGGRVVLADLVSGRSTAFDTKVENLSGRLWWSPAGGQLLLESLDGLGQPASFHVLDTASGKIVTIAGVSAPCFGAWSPDGRKVALAGAVEGGLMALYIAGSPWTAPAQAVAGGAASGLTVVGVGAGEDQWAAWSPSGDALLYVAGPTDTVLNRFLYAAAGDGSNARALSRPIECRGFQWSHDGGTVLFVGRRMSRGALSSSAFTVPANGGEGDIRRLVPNVAYIDWSPDGGCAGFITLDMYDRTHQLLQVIETATDLTRRVAMAIEEYAWAPLAR